MRLEVKRPGKGIVQNVFSAVEVNLPTAKMKVNYAIEDDGRNKLIRRGYYGTTYSHVLNYSNVVLGKQSDYYSKLQWLMYNNTKLTVKTQNQISRFKVENPIFSAGPKFISSLGSHTVGTRDFFNEYDPTYVTNTDTYLYIPDTDLVCVTTSATLYVANIASLGTNLVDTPPTVKILGLCRAGTTVYLYGGQKVYSWTISTSATVATDVSTDFAPTTARGPITHMASDGTTTVWAFGALNSQMRTLTGTTYADMSNTPDGIIGVTVQGARTFACTKDAVYYTEDDDFKNGKTVTTDEFRLQGDGAGGSIGIATVGTEIYWALHGPNDLYHVVYRMIGTAVTGDELFERKIQGPPGVTKMWADAQNLYLKLGEKELLTHHFENTPIHTVEFDIELKTGEEGEISVIDGVVVFSGRKVRLVVTGNNVKYTGEKTPTLKGTTQVSVETENVAEEIQKFTSDGEVRIRTEPVFELIQTLEGEKTVSALGRVGKSVWAGTSDGKIVEPHKGEVKGKMPDGYTAECIWSDGESLLVAGGNASNVVHTASTTVASPFLETNSTPNLSGENVKSLAKFGDSITVVAGGAYNVVQGSTVTEVARAETASITRSGEPILGQSGETVWKGDSIKSGTGKAIASVEIPELTKEQVDAEQVTEEVETLGVFQVSNSTEDELIQVRTDGFFMSTGEVTFSKMDSGMAENTTIRSVDNYDDIVVAATSDGKIISYEKGAFKEIPSGADGTIDHVAVSEDGSIYYTVGNKVYATNAEHTAPVEDDDDEIWTKWWFIVSAAVVGLLLVTGIALLVIRYAYPQTWSKITSRMSQMKLKFSKKK